MPNPTIVAASLDDKELRDSISNLVAHVKRGLHTMLTDTNSTVDAMEKKLKSLKIDSGGSADGGASKRTSKLKEEETQTKANTQAIKENTAAKKENLTFDQQQKGLQTAMGVKSARESYLAFVQGFKAQGEAIARQIKDAEAALNKAVENRVNELNTKLANAKAKLNELNAELAKQRMNAERTGNYSTYNAGITRTTQAIEYQMKHIAELQKKISEVSPNMFTQQVQGISALRREQERVANIMKEDVTTRQQSTSATQQQLTAEQKLTDEIHKQAQAIRESKQWKEKGFVTVNGRDVYNFEGSDTPLKNRVTLEEQLLRLQELEKSTSKEITEEGAKRLTQEQLELAITGSTKETLQKSRDILHAMVETRQATTTFTAQLESANRLNEKLKELRTRYNEMTFGQRMSAEGQEIAKNIRIVTRETQKLQSQLSRPANLREALGHPEKTLDDIAYKIQQLRAYMRGLDTTNARSASEVRTVTYALEELKKKENDLLGKQAQLFGSNNALARSWNYMKNRLAFYFTVGASTSFIRNLIEVRSQYEMNERALGILINSAERGTKIFNELSQMALVSPYTLIELSAAAKQLTAYDIAAKDVVDTTRRLADMAAAVGVPIERLTYALGQIKAYGYLNSRDNRMFANAGIPLVKQLADYYTELEGRLVSTADVYDRIKKKSVSYEDTMQVINRMTDEGGKFFDFQAKMAGTLKVQLANLTLAWNNMLNDIGKESQGILVGGIGALKQMFLHWKDIEHVLNEIIVVFGIYKAAQMASIAMTGTFTKTLDANILAMKRAEAASLQRAALTRTLTAGEMRLIAAQNSVTASDYRMMLSSKSLTKQQALLMVALNRRNTALAQALIRMGLLTAAEIRSMTAGKALSLVWKSMAISIKSAAAAMGSFMVSNWWLLAIGGIYEIWHAWDSYGEHVAEVNRSAAEHAKESLKSIKEYMNSDATRQTLSSASKGSLTDMEASKAWDTMRGKIEEVSSASNTFVAQLMDINDISERLTLGAQYLQDIENARKAISEMDEDAITLSQTVAGGVLGEGLKDDLEDYEEAIDKYANLEKTFIENSVKGWNKYTTEREEQMQEFVSEVKKTTDDIYNVASSKGLNANAQREFFEVAISERAQKEQLGVRGTRLLRMKAEEEYFKFAKSKLEERLQYEQGARRARTQQEIKDLEAQFGTHKAMQESFFDWLSDKHSSEVTRRLGHLTAEEIKAGTWLNGENLKWAKERAQDFAREYGLSFDTLYGYVQKANTWEIHIKTFFDAIGQPLTNVQADYEGRTHKKFKDNPIIKDATSQVEIIKKLQDHEAKLTEEYETAKKAGDGYFVTNKVRMESELKDVRAQIHAYNALTKAEEQAEKKKNKQGGKKDILGDALAKEVQLIGEIQKRYKEYQQMGVNAQEAVTLATEEYGNTLRRTNATLAKYGIATKSSDELAGMDIREVRDYYKALLEGAKNKDNAKGVEAIEKALANINVEITKLDYKKITDGLNNELGKLKEEYELAVELDADPEMGNMFASYFGINTNELPRTFQDAAKKAQAQIDRVFEENGRKDKIDILSMLNKESFDKWVKDSGLKMDSELVKAVEQFRQYLHKVQGDEIKNTTKNYQAIIEKYGGLQAKILKIYKDSVKEQGDIVRQFGDNAQIKQALDLIRQINISQDPAEIARLQEQLATVMRDVVNGNPIAMKTYEASQNEQKSKESKAYWEDFKNSDMYSMVFADMANNSIFSIELIIQKLNELKDKVKEDPTSMKELIRSLENAKEEFAARNPIQGIIDGVDRWTKASQRLKNAKKDLAFAIGAENNAKQQVKDAKQAKDTNKLAVATAVLASATANREKQEKKVAKASNDVQQAQEDTKKSIKGVADTMKGAQDTLSGVSAIFKAFGDDETAEAIDAINQGFSAMISVVMGVYTAMQMLNTAVPWLLAISAALAVIVGLVSFLSGHSDKKITEQVEESERAVKKLENRVESLKGTYDAMTDSAEHSYGAQSAAATLAASSIKEQEIAMRRLMLAETKRQLRLEQSRDSKKRDDDKILSLQKDIISQQNEIDSMLRETNRAVEEVVDSLLGISRGSWAEELTDALISAFKAGEDYMDVFEDSWEEMVQNMVVKTIAAKVIGDALEKHVLSRIEEIENQETSYYRQQQAELEQHKANLQNLRMENENQWWNTIMSYPEFSQVMSSVGGEVEQVYNNMQAALQEGNIFVASKYFEILRAYADTVEKALFSIYDQYGSNLTNALNTAQQTAQIRALNEVLTGPAGTANKDALMNSIKDVFPKIMKTWGVQFGQDAEKELSALQRGIAGITQEQAGALESYWNANTQQQYVQSSLLTQIRDVVVGMNTDVQLSTMAQMLLQLQNNYIVMQSMQAMMESWTVPSGQGIRVELMS